MNIPKTLYKGKHKYTFLKQYNNNVFLYKSELGYKEAFSLYDLSLINNKKIDERIYGKGSNIKYILYDRLLEKEKEYSNIQEIARELKFSYQKIRETINNHNWLDNRWFIERRTI